MRVQLCCPLRASCYIVRWLQAIKEDLVTQLLDSKCMVIGLAVSSGKLQFGSLWGPKRFHLMSVYILFIHRK